MGLKIDTPVVCGNTAPYGLVGLLNDPIAVDIPVPYGDVKLTIGGRDIGVDNIGCPDDIMVGVDSMLVAFIEGNGGMVAIVEVALLLLPFICIELENE